MKIFCIDFASLMFSSPIDFQRFIHKLPIVNLKLVENVVVVVVKPKCEMFFFCQKPDLIKGCHRKGQHALNQRSQRRRPHV